MKDNHDKKNKDLIGELTVLRRRVDELETLETERQKAEKALRNREVKYRQFAETAHDLIVSVDFDFKITYVNQATVEFAGDIDPVGRRLLDFTPPHLHPLQEEIMQKRREGFSDVLAFEWEILHPAGKIVTFDVRATLLTEDGNPAGVMFVGRDITERKKMDAALQKSDKQYRTLFENANEAIFVAQDGNIVFLNPQTALMTGYPTEELLSKPFIEFISRDDREMVIDRHIRRMRGDAIPDRYAFRLIHRDGGIRWVELSAVMISWNGKPATLNFLSDITERKQAEEALRENEALFRNLFEQHAAVTMIIDPADGNIIDANATAAEFYGWTREQLRQKSIQDINILSPEEIRQEMEKASTDERIHFEFRHRRVDGSIRDVEVFSNKIVTKGKELLHSIVHDISNRKRAEAALYESETKFQTIFESLEDIYYQTDRNGIITLISPSVYRISGWSPEELIGQPATVVYASPEDRANLLLVLTEQGYVRDYELMLVKRDGSQAIASLAAHFTYDSGGALTGLAGALRDITERKRTEESLFKSEKKFAAMFHLNPNPMAITNLATGKIVDANEAFSRWTGYDLKEVSGVATLDLHFWGNPEDRQKITGILTTAGEVNDAEVVLRQRNGNLRNVLFSARFIEIEQERHIMTLIQDITERRKMEAALREGEKRYREFADFLPQPVCEFDVNGNLSFVNRSCFKFFGYTKEDYDKGLNVLNMMVPGHHRMALENMQRILNGENSDGSDYTMLRKDGSTFPAIVFSSPVMHEGKPLGLRAIIIDMTERKAAEETLRESEATLRSVFKATPVGLCIMKDRVFQSANKAWYESFGYAESDIIGHATRILYQNEEEYERVGRELYASLLERGLASVQTRIRRKDGAFRDAVLIAAPLESEDLSFGTVVAIEDVTDRRRTEEELKENRKQLANIIEFLPDATLVIDGNGRVIAWNRAIESMTGIRKEDMLGKGDYEYALPFCGERRPILIDLALHPDREMEKQYTAVQRIEDILLDESYTPHLPPGDIHLSATASVLRDSRGEIIAAIECIRDNTERKRMEERLNRAEKMEALGNLAGGVAHDLNNVLGVLVGYSELLLEKLPGNSPLRRYADNILQSSIKGAAIIQDLLTLARRGVAVAEVVDLNRVVGDYLRSPEFEQLKLHHPEVKIWSDPADVILNIKGSPIHIGKTLMNLVSNAMESISGQGEVTIKTENCYLDIPVRGYDNIHEGDYVVLTVSDNGKGISAQDVGKIFEPFYTKKVMGRSGTGLGLTVVWGTVKDHHGYIDVQSEESKGSAFTLYFPVTREESVKTEKIVSPAEYAGLGESILVVDDVQEQRELAMNMLRRLGYRVYAVAGGEAAIEYFKNKKADLMVLDMIMDPGIDGMETYRRIIEINPGQKAVIVSGFSETDQVRKTQEMGAGIFVRKPYILEKIGLAVREELDR